MNEYSGKLNCAFLLCKKTARKSELNILWHSRGFPSGLSLCLPLVPKFTGSHPAEAVGIFGAGAESD
jgi:hypothetical protein